MKIKGEMIESIFSLTGNLFPAFALFKPTEKIVLPSYTVVSDQYLPHISNLYKPKSSRQFLRDLDFLLEYFEPIDLSTLIKMVHEKIPLKKNIFHLSFDDGLRECYDIIFPILKSKGIPATFFLNPSFVDNKDLMHRYKLSLIIEALKNDEQKKSEVVRFIKRKLGIRREASSFLLTMRYSHKRFMDEVAQLTEVDFNSYMALNKPYMEKWQISKLIEEGFTVGAHSMDHPEYYMISEEEQIKQTVESVCFVKNEFNLNYKVFAFPFSDLNISADFIHYLHRPGNAVTDLSFGAAGLRKDIVPTHLQRIPMEKRFSGKEIIKGEFLQAYLRQLTRKNRIKRT